MRKVRNNWRRSSDEEKPSFADFCLKLSARPGHVSKHDFLTWRHEIRLFWLVMMTRATPTDTAERIMVQEAELVEREYAKYKEDCKEARLSCAALARDLWATEYYSVVCLNWEESCDS